MWQKMQKFDENAQNLTKIIQKQPKLEQEGKTDLGEVRDWEEKMKEGWREEDWGSNIYADEDLGW